MERRLLQTVPSRNECVVAYLIFGEWLSMTARSHGRRIICFTHR